MWQLVGILKYNTKKSMTSPLTILAAIRYNSNAIN
jgi:hypothetical protein